MLTTQKKNTKGKPLVKNCQLDLFVLTLSSKVEVLGHFFVQKDILSA